MTVRPCQSHCTPFPVFSHGGYSTSLRAKGTLDLQSALSNPGHQEKLSPGPLPATPPVEPAERLKKTFSYSPSPFPAPPGPGKRDGVEGGTGG